MQFDKSNPKEVKKYKKRVHSKAWHEEVADRKSKGFDEEAAKNHGADAAGVAEDQWKEALGLP